MEPAITQPPTQQNEQQNPNTAAPAAAQGGGDGVQKRIDELVSQRAQYERMAMEQAETNRQLMALLAQQQQVPQQPQMPAAPQTPEGIDPAVAQWLQQTLAAQQQALRQELAPVLGSLQQTTAVQQLRAEAAGFDPNLVQSAEKRFQNWLSNPNVKGFAPTDALIYELGKQAYAAELQKRGQQAVTHGMRGYNQQVDVLNGMSPQPMPGGGAGSAVPSFADQSSPQFDPAKAAQFWGEKAKAQGH